MRSGILAATCDYRNLQQRVSDAPHRRCNYDCAGGPSGDDLRCVPNRFGIGQSCTAELVDEYGCG
jgi:hypothetical protein